LQCSCLSWNCAKSDLNTVLSRRLSRDSGGASLDQALGDAVDGRSQSCDTSSQRDLSWLISIIIGNPCAGTTTRYTLFRFFTMSSVATGGGDYSHYSYSPSSSRRSSKPASIVDEQPSSTDILLQLSKRRNKRKNRGKGKSTAHSTSDAASLETSPATSSTTSPTSAVLDAKQSIPELRMAEIETVLQRDIYSAPSEFPKMFRVATEDLKKLEAALNGEDENAMEFWSHIR
jgi:hypothetical protein